MSLPAIQSKFRDAASSLTGAAAADTARPEAAGGDEAQQDGSQQFLQSQRMGLIDQLKAALGGQQASAPHAKETAACDTIGKFLDDTGKGTLNTDEMKNLAAGKQPDGSGQVSDDVKQAAAWIMGGKKGESGESARWEKIETKDVAGADGLSGKDNFKNIAAENRQAAAQQQDAEQAGLVQMLGILEQQSESLQKLMTQCLGAQSQQGQESNPLGGLGATDVAAQFSKMQQDETKRFSSMIQSA